MFQTSHTIGFPIAEVSPDGTAVLTKVEGSGGLLNRATCTEQLLYEIQDPSAYLTPDVVADFSKVSFEELGQDLVRVRGGSGRMRPATLKVSIGYRDGYTGEGQISYAGPNALPRAELARAILAERLDRFRFSELRFDLIGLNSIHGPQLSMTAPVPYEIRLRAAGRAASIATAPGFPAKLKPSTQTAQPGAEVPPAQPRKPSLSPLPSSRGNRSPMKFEFWSPEDAAS